MPDQRTEAGQSSSPAAERSQTPPAGQESPVGRRFDDAVAVLTLRRRPYNLLDAAFGRQIVEALHWAWTEGARAVVVESGLRHFSAGADLDAMLATATDGNGVLGWRLTDVLRAFDELPLPIVASVHGICVGGGLEVALACDLIVASESAKLGLVEATVGLHPLMGAIQRITQRAGATRAKEMVMLGRRYDARTMERWGIVNRVVADERLSAATMTLARELAAGPTVAHAATKKLVSIAVDQGVRAADEAMSEIQEPIFRSTDFRTGVDSLKQNGPGLARFRGC
ncbi:enoyl-CoA hydratase/isomerase family protein [Streptosporangium sp. 'caverna']|uniref:enoyl-CoA hydratase/isomerase family protein n=1 Tax=Streptosporangium sp. 'caverna' TaxID=2202249 RepID=UPI000D7DC791|nr:enoyl-CoA hydratase/isomerase family protein [Streptosporangium sp. 'caverna']AWS44361.1 enoyl-CoA hydratase/isomerase family protein [Streptosporangium sp. 'caverna']